MTTTVEPVAPVAPGTYRPVENMDAWKRVFSQLGAKAPPTPEGASPQYRRILIPMMVGSSDLFAAREGLLGHALRLRGADVVYVVCDGLAVCDARTFDRQDPKACDSCHPCGVDNLRRLGLDVVEASAFVAPARARELEETARDVDIATLLEHTHAGIDVGRHVYASTLRHFRAGRLELDDPAVASRARQYLVSALLMTEAARNAVKTLRPDKLFSSHGMYVSWGPWTDVARAMGVATDLYGGAWRRNTLLVQHDSDSFVHADDIWPDFAERPLDEAERRTLDAYLRSRETHTEDSFRYFDRVEAGLSELLEELGLSADAFASRTCLFGNVPWDAARYRQEGVFGDMYRWVVETVRHYGHHPEHLLLLKPHPAETRFLESTPEEWTLASVLAREIGELPPNVRWVPADRNVPDDAWAQFLDLALVHTSSVGLEMALAGVPVLTSGAGVHYESSGSVGAARDEGHYFAALERARVGDPETGPDVELARRYAYTMYFRKCLAFEPIDVEGWTPSGIAIQDLAELAPGRFRGLDALCSGILDGAPFAMESR